MCNYYRTTETFTRGVAFNTSQQRRSIPDLFPTILSGAVFVQHPKIGACSYFYQFSLYCIFIQCCLFRLFKYSQRSSPGRAIILLYIVYQSLVIQYRTRCVFVDRLFLHDFSMYGAALFGIFSSMYGFDNLLFRGYPLHYVAQLSFFAKKKMNGNDRVVIHSVHGSLNPARPRLRGKFKRYMMLQVDMYYLAPTVENMREMNN